MRKFIIRALKRRCLGPRSRKIAVHINRPQIKNKITAKTLKLMRINSKRIQDNNLDKKEHKEVPQFLIEKI
jgi:hypothetical protein